MQNIFCSSIYNIDKYDLLRAQSKVNLSLADHNLNYNIIKGLDLLTHNGVRLVNSVPLPSYPKFSKIFIKKEKWNHDIKKHTDDVNIGCINLPLIKQISRYFACYHELKKIIKNTQDERINLLVYDLHLPLVKAIKRIKRKYPFIHTCAILPDIPDAMINVIYGDKPPKLACHYIHKKMQCINQFDCYVFLTEYMKEKVDIKNKPYVIVEGIYDEKDNVVANSLETDKKIILYSGALRSAYGIKQLVDVFSKMENKGYELWICGGGELTDYIREQSQNLDNIKYFGYVSTERIKELQSRATILINPRKNDAEYTKYSFPSKTMEYLASGKPVIAYLLDGYPQDYIPYIICPTDESDEALKNKIIEICSLPVETRNEIGKRNREFILKEKNPIVQCEKIMKMLERM